MEIVENTVLELRPRRRALARATAAATPAAARAGTSTGAAPLREALDWLRDELAPRFEREAAGVLRDPWAARDAYIDVLLDRSPAAVDAFLARFAAGSLAAGSDRVRALKLLELQRHAMLMYTSCGWFFDDLSGIETVQILHYAGRVAQLAQELFRTPVEPELLRRLEKAKSNVPAEGTGRDLYEKLVRPADRGPAAGGRPLRRGVALPGLSESGAGLLLRGRAGERPHLPRRPLPACRSARRGSPPG